MLVVTVRRWWYSVDAVQRMPAIPETWDFCSIDTRNTESDVHQAMQADKQQICEVSKGLELRNYPYQHPSELSYSRIVEAIQWPNVEKSRRLPVTAASRPRGRGVVRISVREATCLKLQDLRQRSLLRLYSSVIAFCHTQLVKGSPVDASLQQL